MIDINSIFLNKNILNFWKWNFVVSFLFPILKYEKVLNN